MTEATPADDKTPEDKTPEDKSPNDQKPAGETGTSLAPAGGGPSGVDPFVAVAAEAPAATEPRPLYSRALDYAAHAAMVVGLVGFAWTVSGHVVSRHPAETAAPTTTPVRLADTGTATPAAKPAAAPAKVDEFGDLRKSNQTMASEIRNLRASLEALRTTVVRERSASSGEDVRALSASLDNLKSSLSGTRSEQSAAIAQLSAKVERLQREERAQPIVAAKPERRDLDTAATASIAPAAAAGPVKPVPTPPAKPTVLASAEPARDTSARDADDADTPQVIAGWVVRDVYQGVALIEGRRGQMEVVPGVSIPGAGTVKSIERHGGAWTVTTTKGQFASAAAPQHEPHHGAPRDYYGPRRWDF